MIGKTILTCSLLAGGIWMGVQPEKKWVLFNKPDGRKPIAEMLFETGENKPSHYIAGIDSSLAAKGREIIVEGRTTGPDGKKTSRQSRHFVCTDCHNTQKEDPDLSVSDPEARLNYAVQNKLSFLPASTLYGVVNRESWYNDDYSKKYGELVVPARKNLKEAIQVCATQCSQGRALSDWEMEAVLHYLWTIQLVFDDLKFDSKISERDTLLFFYNFAKTQGNSDFSNTEADEYFHTLIRKKYLTASPAHFVSSPAPNQREYGANGNPETGKKLYDHSCMSCHGDNAVTNFKFDYEKNTFRFLKRHLKKKEFFNVYFHVREGTYAKPGYRPYMPNFTEERMSKQQLEDLIAFINQQARL